MKHLKHPEHLKHLMWMPGLLFCKHFKELGGKVKDGVHRRQDQKRMLLVLGWIDAIDAIDAIADMGFWGCGLGGMEENKKSGGRDVRAALHPTHIPRRPK